MQHSHYTSFNVVTIIRNTKNKKKLDGLLNSCNFQTQTENIVVEYENKYENTDDDDDDDTLIIMTSKFNRHLNIIKRCP